ncbi:hypothetical protein [Paenibacillus elgii]|uniref:hypothetical protein n=1 Tax=Paenibacillus elgii TaxID=189691 RepID=UPI000248D231|nr:hypothetical protein [Paenibacillus elgii]
MKKYQVTFWWGIWTPNPFIKPNEIVEVEVKDDATKDEIIVEGLKKLNFYCKTYAATISEIQ